MPTLLRTAALLAALPLVGACGGADAEFATRLAPGFGGGGAGPVAVFGVFRDGRMSTRAWDDFAPKLDVLGLEPCPAAYDLEMTANHGDLAAAIDEYTRNYGVTDALLGAFAGATQADAILVVVVSGALPKRDVSADRPRPPPSPNMYGRRTSIAARAAERPDPGALEITASLYSARRRETVALVTLRYTGQSENEAIAKVDARLKELLPASPCMGWDLATRPVSPDAVRGLPED